jgi:hypothetical protein
LSRLAARVVVFYRRLRTNGKHAKPALVACMRKFLVILNAMLNSSEQKTPVTIRRSSASLYVEEVVQDTCLYPPNRSLFSPRWREQFGKPQTSGRNEHECFTQKLDLHGIQLDL